MKLHIVYQVNAFLHIHSMVCRCKFNLITVQKTTIHQVTTMLATPKNVLFLGHNHLLTTGVDDMTL